VTALGIPQKAPVGEAGLTLVLALVKLIELADPERKEVICRVSMKMEKQKVQLTRCLDLRMKWTICGDHFRDVSDAASTRIGISELVADITLRWKPSHLPVIVPSRIVVFHSPKTTVMALTLTVVLANSGFTAYSGLQLESFFSVSSHEWQAIYGWWNTMIALDLIIVICIV